MILNPELTTTPGVVDTPFPVAVSVYPVPVESMESPLNVASPVPVFTETVFVPLSIAPGLALF